MDLAFYATDPAFFGVGAKILGVQCRIKMVGISDVGTDGSRVGVGADELSLPGRDGAQAVVIDGMGVAVGAAVQPVLMEIKPIHVDAVTAERVNITVALTAPVDELDAQLEGRVGRLQELVFVDTEKLIEVNDIRNCGFTDPDYTDFIGFDQGDRHVLRTEQA